MLALYSKIQNLNFTSIRFNLCTADISNLGNTWFLIQINLLNTYYRVATDLENLEKSGNLEDTPESQGICLKSQGICGRIPKVREKSGNFVV